MIGGVRVSRPAAVYMRAASEIIAGGAVSEMPMILSAAIARCISLALWVLSLIARSRSAGSSMSVASEANIAPTFVPTSLSSSARSDTGTCAISGESGSSSRSSR